MRQGRTLLRLTSFAALALAAASLWAGAAGAQCALCRSALEGAGDAAARAMNLGILVLLVPPVAIFCTIFAVAIRRKPGGEEE
jgi:heme/copper-type cytochrome/quinol oxidase subunit 2